MQNEKGGDPISYVELVYILPDMDAATLMADGVVDQLERYADGPLPEPIFRLVEQGPWEK